MTTSTKMEFAVQMTCDSCVKEIQDKLGKTQDIQLISIDLEKEQVVVHTALPSYTVQEVLEDSGRRAVLMGLGSGAGSGHLGAAVAMMFGPSDVRGVTRLVQVDKDTCVIDGTVDGLQPGKHEVYIHELGDLSNGCDSCGEVFLMNGGEIPYGDLGKVDADKNGRAEFRIVSSRVKVWDIIGRSMLIHDQNSSPSKRKACGILARSSGLFQNPKRICACDGVPLWDERDVPIAGPERQNYKQSTAQL